MERIDIHSHILPPDYMAYIERNGGLLEDSMRLPPWDEREALAFMERSEIKWSLVSVSSPHPYYIGDEAEGIAVCRRINEFCAGLVRRHPDKFKFSAIVPLPDVDAAVKEAVYALDELGASGIKLASNSRGQYLGAKELAPLYEELNRRKAVINLHPHRPAPMQENAFSAKVIPLFEFLCDTTRTVLDMIGSGIIDRYPDLKIIVPHCGAFLPSIADRASGLLPHMFGLGLLEEDIHVKDALAKLYYDTAGNPVPNLLPLLLKIAPREHILYGCDYPFTPAEGCIGGGRALEAFLADDPDLRDAVFFKNAETLFA